MINPERVNELFTDCLFKEGENIGNYVKVDVEGITRTVEFHPERLESHRTEIIAMLDELPDEFKESGGGGMSFLNACNDKHGNQWTGFHQRMEQLFQLGIGINAAKCLMPREMWEVLPGGMPYYVILN